MDHESAWRKYGLADEVDLWKWGSKRESRQNVSGMKQKGVGHENRDQET